MCTVCRKSDNGFSSPPWPPNVPTFTVGLGPKVQSRALRLGQPGLLGPCSFPACLPLQASFCLPWWKEWTAISLGRAAAGLKLSHGSALLEPPKRGTGHASVLSFGVKKSIVNTGILHKQHLIIKILYL